MNAHRCKRGAEAASALVAGAKTQAERQHWERVEMAWRSRWKAAVDALPERIIP